MVLRWHKQRNVVVENGPASTIVPIEPSRNGVSVCSVLLNGRTRSRTSNGAIYIEIIDRYRTERIYQMKFLTMYDRGMKALVERASTRIHGGFSRPIAARARPPGGPGAASGPVTGTSTAPAMIVPRARLPSTPGKFRKKFLLRSNKPEYQ